MADLEMPQLVGDVTQATVDLLAFMVFGDPAKDAGFKSVDKALGGVLADTARAESFEGKASQTISIHTHGKLPARRVMVLGAGPRGDFTNPQIRDSAASVAQAANKCGAATVGFVLPSLGANREPALVQMVSEGVALGTYKFS